jgi:hypothetical protein
MIEYWFRISSPIIASFPYSFQSLGPTDQRLIGPKPLTYLCVFVFIRGKKTADGRKWTQIKVNLVRFAHNWNDRILVQDKLTHYCIIPLFLLELRPYGPEANRSEAPNLFVCIRVHSW